MNAKERAVLGFDAALYDQWQIAVRCGSEDLTRPFFMAFTHLVFG